MPALLLRFPGGRYHATPFEHHVNEGHIEWPPSPWRLLRALIAVGFATQHWKEVPPVGRRLIEKLACVLPTYCLPPVNAAHTRHFMPVGRIENGRELTTLVFDTWLDIGNGEVTVHWPCPLAEEEAGLLHDLAGCLNYLGRSESWVDANLIPDNLIPAVHFNAFPHRAGDVLGAGWEQIALLAPLLPGRYAEWRNAEVNRVAAQLPGTSKRPSKKVAGDLQPEHLAYPLDLVDCFTKDTAWWKLHRWAQPPGSQRVIYWRSQSAIELVTTSATKAAPATPVTTMVLSMTTPSGNCSSLPARHRTLQQAELLHQAIISSAARGQRIHCPELTGRDEDGSPLKGRHGHLHVLPIDCDADGHLDHIVLHAPMGFGAEAQEAVRRLKRTWTKGGAGTIQLALAGFGGLDLLRDLPAPLDRYITAFLAPPDGARTWISATPFVPPRFLKRSGANTLGGQINAELSSRGLPMVEEISPLPRTPESLALRHYVRSRRRGGVPPPLDVGYALKLTFSQPIRGPLTIGYGSHFGLGLFLSINEQ
ncbi:type I-G CRISPR-associated protein Csb2 [Paludibaculum fermentans]|uniref:type I-G CRISPR-associated protein Csb2 n=1 Tax=Paludibaculum fermentans TaxID=1473598 RepID=UPI003EBB64F4